MPRGQSRRSIELIEASLEILREIQPATVRAICYKLFTLGLLDSMVKNETNRVSRHLVAAREDGVIPWTWIVDETRAVEAVATWANPAAFAQTVTRSYRRDKWAAQSVRVEVWSEKGTVRGTLAPVLDRLEVPFRVMHGFASATAVYEIASVTWATVQPLVALYVGDWDPSGLWMSEQDLPNRLDTYQAAPSLMLRRVALVEDDLAGLPPFEAITKRGDTRFRWFVESYGEQCWELDALDPRDLRVRVEAAITAWLNRDIWDRYVRAEAVEIASITEIVRAFTTAD